MFLNTFHGDKNFEKKDVVKIIAKTGLKHFRLSLIVSIIQTSKFYMELYFQTMCLTPEIMINPKPYHLPLFSPCKYRCDKV